MKEEKEKSWPAAYQQIQIKTTSGISKEPANSWKYVYK